MTTTQNIRSLADAEERAKRENDRRTREARIAREIEQEAYVQRLTAERTRCEIRTKDCAAEVVRVKALGAKASGAGRRGDAYEIGFDVAKAARAFEKARDAERHACLALHQCLTRTAPPTVWTDPNAYDPRTEGVLVNS
jgi:hypothetical protein